MLRIGYLDEAAPAEFLDARVEELARIIASKRTGDKVREGGAALAEKRPRRF
jgi:hypothetical protein